jgi:WD40 repeat protein
MAALIPSTTPIRAFGDHGDRVAAVAALHDERMVTGSYDGMLRLWDLKTGVMLKKMEGHRSRVRALAVSPDGKWIASGDESGELIAWHGQTGEPLDRAIEKSHWGWILSLDFSQDSIALASGSSDTITKLWSTSSWTVKRSLGCGGIVHCVRYSPRSDRPLLAIATDHGVHIYRNHRGTHYYNQEYSPTSPFPAHLTTTIGHGINSLAWTSDGSRLFLGGNSADPSIQEWDTSTWQQVGDLWKGHFKNIHTVTLNSRGTLLASASHDNHIRLWRLSDRRTIAIFKHSEEVNCVTFSADDKHILSGGVDKKISEWPTSAEDALPEDGPNDGLMMEQPTHQVSFFLFSCPFVI